MAIRALQFELKAARAESKTASDKIAGAEKAASEASARADVAEKAASDAVEARYVAEADQAVAEAEADALRERTVTAEAHSADVQVRLNAFEERKVADLAVADLADAEATLATAKQQAASLQNDLQVAEAEQVRLQVARVDSVNAAERAWSTVDEAAEVVLTTETILAEARKASDAASEAIENGVKILDADGLAQALTSAETHHAEASDTLARLNAEARAADVKVGCLATEVQHADRKVSALAEDLEAALRALEVAKVSADEAAKSAESAEIEAVAAERRFSALVAAEQQSAELATKVATVEAEKSVLVAQNGELKGIALDALRASGCTLSLNRLTADEEVAYYRVDLGLVQGHDLTFGIHIVDDEGEETIFRTIPSGSTLSEPFEVERGYNAKIRVLPPTETAECLGAEEVAAYLVA